MAAALHAFTAATRTLARTTLGRAPAWIGGAAITFALLLALPLPAMQTPRPTAEPLRAAPLTFDQQTPWNRTPESIHAEAETYDLPSLQPPSPQSTDTTSAAAMPNVPTFAQALPGPRLDTSLSVPAAPGPAAPPTGSPAFALGQVDTAPRVLHRTKPEYPAEARRKGRTGTVLLGFVVEADGSVSRVRVLEANPPGVFDQHAIRAVRQWTFRPGERGGSAVATRVRLPVHFRLE
ncbi:outer membrane transport energization protein TonB [Paucidesulfovibrio gracilis DSM 16080]|uniref:Outer membrane transport energization protein TonB n=1 Tax=Paucidesulfovibrio gracilis DSM 16080 TaxID=1121449 RepID=A0A1T4WZN9_9BACT|nr:energy transducer TonB [Paucidesulfovibrio gracilis]SKA82071.1 outer membrane transport energization protein TonB [Paucidesulfovibrio gracilis DSM 16080]